jgi:hypothetical protein
MRILCSCIILGVLLIVKYKCHSNCVSRIHSFFFFFFNFLCKLRYASVDIIYCTTLPYRYHTATMPLYSYPPSTVHVTIGFIHSFIRSFIHSISDDVIDHLFNPFVNASFIHLFIHSIHPSIHPSVHSFVQSIHPFTHLISSSHYLYYTILLYTMPMIQINIFLQYHHYLHRQA